MAAWPMRLLSCTERMLIFRSPARLGEVVDQLLFERQVDQPPPPPDPRILKVLPAGARFAIRRSPSRCGGTDQPVAGQTHPLSESVSIPLLWIQQHVVVCGADHGRQAHATDLLPAANPFGWFRSNQG